MEWLRWLTACPVLLFERALTLCQVLPFPCQVSGFTLLSYLKNMVEFEVHVPTCGWVSVFVSQASFIVLELGLIQNPVAK